jgi:ring-1,2-phenylacetyl-CoA epoxidase subunit PaaE
MAGVAPWIERARGFFRAQWVRDARMILDGLAGRPPPPFTSRRPAVPPGIPRTLVGARSVRVVAVARETPDAVSLTLVDRHGEAIAWLPGQFFTVAIRLRGEVLRRPYSASIPMAAASPAGSVRLTIKRVAGGMVSQYLNDHATVGDVMDVFGPSGSFVVEGAPAGLVLLGGGSGVTPLLAIARDALTRLPGTRVAFVVGNRSIVDILFREDLAALESRYPVRLALRFVLSDPPSEWTGGTGMLDSATTARELDGLSLDGGCEYFVCGPAPMMESVRAALQARGVPDKSIHEERFSAPVHSVPMADVGGDIAMTAVLDGREYTFVNHAHETVLDSALGQRVPVPYSCTMGGCGACRMKLREGAMTLEEPNCLSAEERAQGYVLTCIGRATQACVLEAEAS